MDALAAALGAALAGGPALALLPANAPPAVLAALRSAYSAAADVPAEVVVICPTSGSTGAPRGVLMPAPALLAAVAARDRAQGGTPTAWIAGTPPATAPGIMVALRAAASGVPAAAWTPQADGGPFTAAGFLPAARDLLARAAAAGVPARASLVARQFGRLVADPAGLGCLAEFESVLVGGGPVDAHLVAAARAAGVRVVRTYGMTETLGGCVYEGYPVPGVVVALGGEGEVLIGGKTLAAGYTTGPLPCVDGLLRTGDRGRLTDGRLELLGRFDEIVTVGGANVDVARVREVVATAAGVLEAAVVAVPDPHGGMRLVAHVVGEVDPGALRARVAEQLGTAAVPEVRSAAALPALPGGKVDLDSLKEGSQ